MNAFVETVQTILRISTVFFMVYMTGYSTLLFLSVAVGSSTLYHEQKRKRLKNVMILDCYLPISVIVPAYNEEVTVVSTVRSLLALDYPHYEIIVVDDGSKDETSNRLIEAFQMREVHMPIRRQVSSQPEEHIYITTREKVKLTLIRKRNGGKADALNMGINAASFPYFLCMDADSILQYNSLQNIAAPLLEDSRIVAVGGYVRPCNGLEFENSRVKRYHLPGNILACMQVLEYDRSFLASRILFDKFNGSMIISGAFGLFRKDLVIAVGGYDTDTMGEDMELVVKLHDYCVENDVPYVIHYATDAICWTQVPESLRDLFRQRRRWHIGLFDSLRKHTRLLLQSKHGTMGYISYCYFLLYELLSPFVEVVGLLIIVLALAASVLNIQFMAIFMLLYAVYCAVLSLAAFFSRIYTIDLTISPLDILKVILLCLFEVTVLHIVLTLARFTALRGYRKRRHDWGRIERSSIEIK